MATTITTHCKMGIVDASGNVNVLYPQTTGSDVSITPTSVVTATTVQGLVNSLKASAFISNFTGINDSSTTSTTATYSASKIAALNSDLINKINARGTVTQVTGGTGLNGGSITSSGTLSVKYGSTAGTACQGNDSRLSDNRDPWPHAGIANNNLNNYTRSGFYSFEASCTNLPVSGQRCSVLVIQQQADETLCCQLAIPNGYSGLYYRYRYTTGWEAWSNIK